MNTEGTLLDDSDNSEMRVTANGSLEAVQQITVERLIKDFSELIGKQLVLGVKEKDGMQVLTVNEGDKVLCWKVLENISEEEQKQYVNYLSLFCFAPQLLGLLRNIIDEAE